MFCLILMPGPPVDHLISPKSQLQKHMVCAIDFSASILMLKTISILVSLGKCYSVWAGLTCITSQTLCHLSLQI